MGKIDEIYKKALLEIRKQAEELGFLKMKEVYSPKDFGNRYIVFQKNDQALQFIQDRREHWFLLQYCENLNIKPFSPWKDVFLIHFDDLPESETEAVTKLVELSKNWKNLKIKN